MPIAASLVVKVAAETADVERGLNQANRSVNQFASDAARSGASAADGFARIGTAAGLAGGVIAVGLGKGISEAANFGSAMSSVGAVSQASAGQMQQLSAAALALGSDTQLAGIDATDAAQAMQQLSQAGVSVEAQLGGATKGALLLASAGEVSVGEAAETAARAMQTFAMGGESVAHIADVITAASVKSTATVHDLNEAFNQSASVAQGAGLSLEQLTGTLALMAQYGMKGSDAGTSLRTTIQRLTAPTDEAAKLMTELGIQVFDSSGKMRDWADVADSVQQALAGLSDEQRQAALQTLGGADAVRTFNVLLKEGGKGVRDWTAAVNDQGIAARIGAERNANLKGSLDQLKASAQTAAIVFGSQLAPDIDALAKKLTEAVDWFSRLDPSIQRNIGHAAELAAGLGLLTFATSKVVSEIRNLGGAIADVIGWFAKKQAAKEALEAANKNLATSVGGTNTALKGLVLTLGESVLIIGGTALAVRGLMEVVGKTGEHFADVAQGNQNLTRELTLQQTALSQVGQAHKDIVSDFTAWVHLQDEATQKTTSAIQVYNQYVAFLNEIGTNTQNLQPITIATGLAVGALGAAFAQTAVSGRGLVDSANAIAAAMDAGTVAMARQAQAAYGAGLATGAFAAASYDLNTALGQLQAESGAYSGQIGVLQARIDVLQQQQKDGIALTQAEQAELATLLEARNRLADNTGILAAQERAHVLAMVGLNTEFGNNVTGADALAQASLDLGQAMGSGAVRGAQLADGINASAQAALDATVKAHNLRDSYEDIPASVTTTWPTPGLDTAILNVDALHRNIDEVPPTVTTTASADTATAVEGIGAVTGAIAAVPKSFTVTAYVDINPATQGILDLSNMLPRSPAKEGPFRVLPNWDALFDGIAPALDRAKALIDQFGDDTLKKMIETISSISGTVKGGVEALTALGTFKVPHSDRAGIFAGALVPVVQSFVDSAAQFKEEALKVAGTFADAAGKVVGVVKGGVDALSALSDFVRPSDEAIGRFKFAVEFLVHSLGDTAAMFESDFVAGAAVFSEGAGKALGILKAGVDGLTALIDFKRPTDAAIGAFKFATEFLVRSLGDSAAVMDTDFAAAAGKWSESAGKGLALLGNGVKGLSELADFRRPTDAAIGAFKFAVEFLVQSVGDSAAVMDKDFVAAAAAWSDGAGKALAIIGNGVDGLTKLADFKAPSARAIDEFAAAIAYLVRRFGEVAVQMGIEGVAQAGAFGVAAGSALGAAKTGIDAFIAMGKLSVPSQQAIDQLLAGIQYTVGRMGEIADQLGTAGMQRAIAFATAAGTVFTTLKTAIELLGGLEKLKKAPMEAVDELLSGVKGAVAKAGDLIAEAQDLERQAIRFRDTMNSARAIFAEGMGGGGGMAPAVAGGVAVPTTPPATGGGHTSTTVVNFNQPVYGLPNFETAVRSAVANAERRGG
jgi:TP901 family phage tail tape measure protein